MEIEVKKFDNQGRGLSFIEDKILFIPKCIPGEIVDVDITKENKKYYEGKINKLIKSSDKRVESPCKYFDVCGGCNLLHLNYEDTLSYKENKIKDIFNKYLNYEIDVNTVKSDNIYSYRNKIILHIKNKKLGLIDEENNLIDINQCLMISDEMNNVLSFVKSLNIINGSVLIRENYNKEILISITAENTLHVDTNNLDSNIKGVILNNEIIYGVDNFIEKINDFKFKVSYKSFFQINRNITSKLFNLINDNIEKSNIVLDLYCGVGTLGINASYMAKKVYGIDNLESNIKDAIENKKINNIENIEFIYGDASIFPKYVDNNVDTIIVDPPRNGLNKLTLQNILLYNSSKIIYVSCDPFTLVRDLKELSNKYNIKKYYLLDMFPFTHHVETVCILERK